MEFDNNEFSVIVPDYLINENEESENDLLSSSEENEENEESENDLLSSSEENEENEENEVQNEIDYSSILQEMNTRLETIETTIETQTTVINEGINGLLADLFFIDFVAFTVFVFLMLFIVIKFFKQFF